MKPDTKALLDAAECEDGIPDVDSWIDSPIAAIQQQERDLEMMTEALRIASTVVESLHLECDRNRQENKKNADADRYFAAEFEVWQRDEMVASASGPRDDALREAMHYAAQYQQDGPARVFEVTRTLVK